MNRRFSVMFASLTFLLSLGISATVWGEALVYEGFDYEVIPDETRIGGQTGGTGWDGAWEFDVGNPWVKDDGYTWGVLPAVGGRAEGSGHQVLHRSFGSTLLDAGLLNDGAEMWFSMIYSAQPQGILTNLEVYVAIGTDRLTGGWWNDDNGNSRWPRRSSMYNDGEGIGFFEPEGNGTVGQLRTVYWQDDDALDNDAGDAEDGYSDPIRSDANEWEGYGTDDTMLVVGKIQWGTGGAGETISLYIPGEDYDLDGIGDPIQTLTTPDLTQSAFDTFAVYWKDSPAVDEIRIGATMEDVLGLAGPDEQTGDFNGDGAVEAADLALLLGNWGQTTQSVDWTTNWDGFVDANELADLLGNWGAGLDVAAAAALDMAAINALVPEPASMTLLGLCGLAMIRRRRA